MSATWRRIAEDALGLVWRLMPYLDEVCEDQPKRLAALNEQRQIRKWREQMEQDRNELLSKGE